MAERPGLIKQNREKGKLKKRICLSVQPDVYDEFFKYSEKAGATVSYLVTEFMRQTVENNKKKKRA